MQDWDLSVLTRPSSCLLQWIWEVIQGNFQLPCFFVLSLCIAKHQVLDKWKTLFSISFPWAWQMEMIVGWIEGSRMNWRRQLVGPSRIDTKSWRRTGSVVLSQSLEIFSLVSWYMGHQRRICSRDSGTSLQEGAEQEPSELFEVQCLVRSAVG